MQELYWLSVIGKIGGVATVFMVLSVAVAIIATAHSITMDTDESGEKYRFDFPYTTKTNSKAVENHIAEVKRDKHVTKLALRISIPVAVVSLIGFMFIPTTRQLYAIYGIGSAIDCVKADSTATQLPHKAIVALDKYLEKMGEND